jgi:hypothetical protein
LWQLLLQRASFILWYIHLALSKNVKNRNEGGRFGTVKSDSTHHFFGNACTKSEPLQFSQLMMLLFDIAVILEILCSTFGFFQRLIFSGFVYWCF